MPMKTSAFVIVFMACAAQGHCEGMDETSVLQVKGFSEEKVVSKHEAQKADFEDIEGVCDFVNKDTNAESPFAGVAPKGDGPFPLAVYLPGTYAPFHSPLAEAMLKEMAERNFVAITISYSNMKYPMGNCGKFQDKAGNAGGCVNKLCELSKVDCSLGLAMYGWSQGGQLAQLTGNYTKFPVTAVLSFSGVLYNKNARDKQADCLVFKVPQQKRRIIIGENDGLMGGNGKMGTGVAADVISNCQEVSDYSESDCTSGHDCIQHDGSGYYVGTQSETGVLMTHFWFIDFAVDKTGAHFYGFSKAFSDPPKTDAPWGREANFDWLAETAKVPISDLGQVPTSDDDCTWDYPAAECAYPEYCEYRYEFGDFHLGASCRLKA